MNTRDMDVLLSLSRNQYIGQRELSKQLGFSLGGVNTSLQALLAEGYIDEKMCLAKKSRDMLLCTCPKRAVLLAAGGSTVNYPFYAETPRPLLKVYGETLVDRIICQLHEAGIFEIYIVVGYAKEKFEYLIDKYGVELIVNPRYAETNNLHSLWLARDCIENSYIVPCDMYFRDNPFRSEEIYSWYAVSDDRDVGSSVRINRKRELAAISGDSYGNRMIGLTYLTSTDGRVVADRLEAMDRDRRFEGSFWEETLYDGDRMFVASRLIPGDGSVELDNPEALWKLEVPGEIPLSEIASALNVSENEITDFAPLKSGTTNISLLFSCSDKRYILRMCHDRSNKLVDHNREASVYSMLSDIGRSESVVYLNGETGLKISEYVENSGFCDPQNRTEVSECMKLLRSFHELKIPFGQKLDLFDSINYFESLWGGEPSVYRDYEETKRNVFSLREYIDAQEKELCLTHIDAVPDNFLISDDGIRLIDWEYAAAQDPHLDIAMFALYSMYTREETDFLIDSYFTEGCSPCVRLKIYCYMAVGGLLWSNWCEYRQRCGTQFGEYSLRQYRYAKDYYRIVIKELQDLEECDV